jgi:symplekin
MSSGVDGANIQVIQAVSTYRSLVGFVANTILPRLIAKKVWLNDKYWSGFSILSKVIAPASFGALLQLPKDQIKDLVNKQPGLKPGLRAFMASKPGMAKAQALTEVSARRRQP